MSIEAMKLALDCLEDIFGKDKIDVGAINALRQAIAEAERQEPDDLTIAYMTGFHAGKNKDALQPEQEPVAWLESEPSTKNWPLHDLFANSWSNAYSSRWHVGSKKPDAPLGNRLTPLYTTPPQRKPEQESDALFDGQVTDVYLIDGHALPPSAIHEALAQPKPKQKPVVFFRTDNGWRKEEFEKTLVKKIPLDTTPPKPHVWFDFSNVPLDAAPPQREWVGLTDEEKESFWRADQMTQKEWGELFTAIEAKLREKNGE